VDFYNLPPDWTRVRIYTLSGDLVKEITPMELQPNGQPQHEGKEDQQASWNLVSRNGQAVASGIYMFAVERQGRRVSHRGKFVLIR
jgi:hypothetical protein